MSNIPYNDYNMQYVFDTEAECQAACDQIQDNNGGSKWADPEQILGEYPTPLQLKNKWFIEVPDWRPSSRGVEKIAGIWEYNPNWRIQEEF